MVDQQHQRQQHKDKESKDSKMMKQYEIKFTKMQGAGNDFTLFKKEEIKVLNSTDTTITLADLSYISKRIAHRKLGVGCDQIIIVADTPNPSETDYEMLIFNSDGSQAIMCGNGIRCFTKYIIDNNIKSLNNNNNNHNSIYSKSNGHNNSNGQSSRKGSLNGKSHNNSSNMINNYDQIVHRVHTLAGTIISSPVCVDECDTMLVKVNMGNALALNINLATSPIVNDHTTLSLTSDPSMYLQRINVDDSCHLDVAFVSMGNPHCIIFLQDNIDRGNLSSPINLDTFDISIIGQKLARHPIFYDSCNIEFVSIIGRNKLKVRVWERGAGETLACGTGASAVAVAAILTNKCEKNEQVSILMPGGELLIDWNQRNPSDTESFGKVFKTGPACTVFSSTIKF